MLGQQRNLGLCILVFALLAGFAAQGSNLIEDIVFEEAKPALELLQRGAKAIHVAKEPSEELKYDVYTGAVPGEKGDDATDSSAFGISANGVGNLPIFISGVITDLAIMFVCFIVFAVASRMYPLVYSANAIKGFAPQRSIPDGLFGWAVASWSVTLDEAWGSVGLDHAMLLEFTNLGLNTFKWIALPMFFIMGPMNYAYGGNAAGQDHESWFSMGNVKFYCWLYWPISVAICYVVWCVTSMCHHGMRIFMPRRFEWLLNMAQPRCNTILMLGIPPQYQSDEACTSFWESLLPGSVDKVMLAKDTSKALLGLVHERTTVEHSLKKATAQWELVGKQPEMRPLVRETMFGSKVDAIGLYTRQIDDLNLKIKEARGEIAQDAAAELGLVNRTTGFITFKKRRDAEVALRLDLSSDVKEWVLDYPPQPCDVIWSDMTQDPTAEASRHLFGYALTAGLVIIYMPAVVFICNVAELINLGPFQPIWSSEAPSLGLTIMVDFLPTILMLIFKSCFSLYDKTQAQYKLSVWYWWMNVLYVVLITALGTNFMSFVTTLSQDPLRIFSLLADTMPSCTHYYMNYIAMQTFVHWMVLTRYVPLTKFRAFSGLYSEEEAKEMAEPEDQDYYGIGSRTARWSTMMCIGIVYGTLSPPVSLLTLFLMLNIRVIYGYMFCYAETKKSDLGGIFFVRALHNMYTSLHIYLILMLGVLFQRAPNYGPVLVVFCAWAYVFYSQRKFYTYKWERLPFSRLADKTDRPQRQSSPLGECLPQKVYKSEEVVGSYVQPELND